MRNQIFLEDGDQARGTSRSIVLGDDDAAIFMPEAPEERLRVCAEIGEALDVIRRSAYSDLDR